MSFGARVRIDLAAIRSNLGKLSARASGAPIMAVIKANAYGHGLVPVARVLGAASALAVARISEARTLRRAGIEWPLVVLGGPLAPAELDEARALDVQLVVHDPVQIGWLEAAGSRIDKAWLKVDTGMHRLGIAAADAPSAIERLRQAVPQLGIMTHFACADDPADPETEEQVRRLLPALEGFEGELAVANSAALLGGSDALDALRGASSSIRLWARPGLSLYGISPFRDQPASAFGLAPAMQFESRLAAVKRIAAGDPVGYGGTWHAPVDTWLGLVAAGYGDGYSRYIPSGTPVLVNGRRVPVAGRISMDLTAVDLGPEAVDRVGDPVVLWGPGLPVEEVARHAGTIPYQLVAGILHRETGHFDDAEGRRA